MGLHGATSRCPNGCCGDDASRAAAYAEITDRILVDGGRRVRTSELCELARRLEQLESTMVASGSFAPEAHLPQQPPDAHESTLRYDPLSRLGTNLASMLFGTSLSPSESSANTTPLFGTASGWPVLPEDWHAADPALAVGEIASAKTRLLYLLVTCAECMQHGETALATELITDMRLLLAPVGVGSGVGRVVYHFIDALNQRLCYSPTSLQEAVTDEWAFYLYDHFYKASPLLKAAHLSANEAILGAFQGYGRVHIIDLNLQLGLQWPALLQSLSLRPGGPPAVRLTAVSFPSPAGRGAIRRGVGTWLAMQARTLGVEEFVFRGVMPDTLEEVEGLVRVPPGEAVAVNSVMQLHRFLDETDETGRRPQQIDAVLGWIHRLTPNIVTLVEQDANHNCPMFVDRVKEALSFYSCMFETLEMEERQQHPQLVGIASVAAETYLRREIINIVSCEEEARVERHEPHAMWWWRMRAKGFRPAPLPSSSLDQASALLALSGCADYTLSQPNGCLTLGRWRRPLISTSAWTVEDPPTSNTGTSITTPSGVKNMRANCNCSQRSAK